MAVDPTAYGTLNPFTLIYRTLLAAFASDVGLQNPPSGSGRPYVFGGATGNLPDMTDPNFVRPLESLTTADAPYLLLQRVRTSYHWGKTNRLVGFTATHRLMCYAADLRMLDVDFVSWRAFVVLFKLQPEMGLGGLVETIDAAEVRDGPQDVLGGLRTVGVLDIPVRGYVPRQFMV